MQEVHVGKVYKHFKGHQYLVLCIAMHTETNEIMVIYQDLHDQDKIYARPYDMFISRKISIYTTDLSFSRGTLEYLFCLFREEMGL